MRLFLCILTLLGLAFSEVTFSDSKPHGVEVHPDLSFECTYHFINLAPGEFVILDVIRSQKNSIRFFHVDKTGLVDSFVKTEDDTSKFRLSDKGDQITGRSAELNFGVRFSVIQKGKTVPPLNPFGLLDISLLDYPLVKYEGTIRFGDKTWSLTADKNSGTISHHYGRKLPGYLYFNTFKTSEKGEHFVGAISTIPTALGGSIKGFYVLASKNGKSRLLTIYNSTYSLTKKSQTEWELKICSADKEVVLRIVLPTSRNEYLAHKIDGNDGMTVFATQVSVLGESTVLDGIVESRKP